VPAQANRIVAFGIPDVVSDHASFPRDCSNIGFVSVQHWEATDAVHAVTLQFGPNERTVFFVAQELAVTTIGENT
jgi:hypothetical protein